MAGTLYPHSYSEPMHSNVNFLLDNGIVWEQPECIGKDMGEPNEDHTSNNQAVGMDIFEDLTAFSIVRAFSLKVLRAFDSDS